MYFADLHLHSRYSIATAKNSTLPELVGWAARKGIRVLASGDFTHPAWSSEIQAMLRPSEDGLYRLLPEFLPKMDTPPHGFGPGEVGIMLNGEISSIYKQGGRVRKSHNLVFLPDVDAMLRFNSRLGKLGNIASDGRPIVGLSSKQILEIALESSDDAFVAPAHVWTPWFSVLGSKSGFDSLEECFGELVDHIFAIETGLSSDPIMNAMVGGLDRFTLISNSDTHSPSKLGRECNIFSGTPGRESIIRAIKAGAQSHTQDGFPRLGGDPENGRRVAAGSDEDCFLGTVEFFPEEGKYHLDGHRKCEMRLMPEDTRRYNGKCPVCGGVITVGVMNRVYELADRDADTAGKRSAPFFHTVPLTEIISEALNVGPASKKVTATYNEMLETIGPELYILLQCSMETVRRRAPARVAEGLSRVRQGAVSIQAGYDGEYGTVSLFPGEKKDKTPRILPFEYEIDSMPAPAWDSLVEDAAPKKGKRAATKKPRKKKSDGQGNLFD